ncbi:MAG: threonine--tRNA ligase [Firmicutes bacterium]|nr:threonine--tRNA ligase [Bacillota bacterium]
MHKINVELKDNSIIQVKKDSTILEVAQTISAGLAKVAYAGIVDGILVDLRTSLDKDCKLEIVTNKDKEGMLVFRHTATHIMAQAVLRLYPFAQLATGPATENGYFYDIDFGDFKITQDDLVKIESEMHKIIKSDFEISVETVTKAQAKAKLQNIGQTKYKLLLLNDIPDNKSITLFTQGEFVDLCSGPHLSHTGQIKAFKLTQLTGAYFKGNQSQKMLTRIYGVAFEKNSQLQEHLTKLEEAKKRDHIKLGRELGLFTTVDCVGQGLPLFGPKGAKILQTLIRWVEDEETKRDYVLTRTPIIAKNDLYKISGHWDKYRDGMFVIGDNDSNYMAIRPMTCPFQYFIYKSTPHSYRDLPIRYAETSTLMRNEDSGEMHGLIRIRQFTLSDGHIVCTSDQIEEEFKKALDLVNYLLDTLGLRNDITYRFSKHDPANMSKYIDNPSMWGNAENSLKTILDLLKIDYVESIGDAAFYGPKLDIQIKNVYGKEDTIITIQLDFALADRYNMEYTDADGAKKRPVIIHRSSIGCYERTLALLIEKYAGAFPTWLAPIQVVVMSLTDRTALDTDNIVKQLKSKGISAIQDNRSEKIGYKIREAQLQKIPYMLIVGDKEKTENVVAVRDRKNGDLGTMSLYEFENKILVEIENKIL